jgi:hypothetical protein
MVEGKGRVREENGKSAMPGQEEGKRKGGKRDNGNVRAWGQGKMQRKGKGHYVNYMVYILQVPCWTGPVAMMKTARCTPPTQCACR